MSIAKEEDHPHEEQSNGEQPLLKTVTILVCGSRNYDDAETISNVLNMCRKKYGNISIIHGGCSGADTIASYYAVYCKISSKAYPADWKKYGKGAGPIRNTQMLDEGNPSLVLAFHRDINSSKGTRNMAIQAMKRRIPVSLIPKKSDSIQTLTLTMLM